MQLDGVLYPYVTRTQYAGPALGVYFHFKTI